MSIKSSLTPILTLFLAQTLELRDWLGWEGVNGSKQGFLIALGKLIDLLNAPGQPTVAHRGVSVRSLKP